MIVACYYPETALESERHLRAEETGARLELEEMERAWRAAETALLASESARQALYRDGGWDYPDDERRE